MLKSVTFKITTACKERNPNRHNIRSILRMVKVFRYIGTNYIMGILEDENKKSHVLL
jgi:hypothetical protein